MNSKNNAKIDISRYSYDLRVRYHCITGSHRNYEPFWSISLKTYFWSTYEPCYLRSFFRYEITCSKLFLIHFLFSSGLLLLHYCDAQKWINPYFILRFKWIKKGRQQFFTGHPRHLTVTITRLVAKTIKVQWNAECTLTKSLYTVVTFSY